MKELTREQKIAVVENAIRKDSSLYICRRISDVANEMGFITNEEEMHSTTWHTAKTLVPELVLFKPYDAEYSGVWFDDRNPMDAQEKRRKLLKRLLDRLKHPERNKLYHQLYNKLQSMKELAIWEKIEVLEELLAMLENQEQLPVALQGDRQKQNT
jgi:hypothetical protein